MKEWQDITKLIGDEVLSGGFPWQDLAEAAMKRDMRTAERILKDQLGIRLWNSDWHLAAIRIEFEATWDRYGYAVSVKTVE